MSDLQISEQYTTGPIINYVQNDIKRVTDNMWRSARLETKKYDEVLDSYRRNLYSLRRVILTGDAQQRKRVLYMFIQVLVHYVCL